MAGAIVGYKRVSTLDQNTDSQLSGVELHKEFVDKISGSSLERPQLEVMLNYLREGDTLVVNSMDRLARNLFDLQSVVKRLTSSGVKVKFIRENLEFTGETSPIANLMLNVMGAVAEFEKALIKERQLEGIRKAKEKGRFKNSGRKRKLSGEEMAKALEEAFVPGTNRSAVARKYNISRGLLYKQRKGKES